MYLFVLFCLLSKFNRLSQMHSMRHEIYHFVRHLHNYIVHEVVELCWNNLTEALEGATDLDELITHHEQYLHDLQKKMFLYVFLLFTSVDLNRRNFFHQNVYVSHQSCQFVKIKTGWKTRLRFAPPSCQSSRCASLLIPRSSPCILFFEIKKCPWARIERPLKK